MFIKTITQMLTNILGTMAMLQLSVVSNFCITKFQISSANVRKGHLCLYVPTSLLASLYSWGYLDNSQEWIRSRKTASSMLTLSNLCLSVTISPSLSSANSFPHCTLWLGVKCVQSGGVLLVLAILWERPPLPVPGSINTLPVHSSSCKIIILAMFSRSYYYYEQFRT